MNWQNWHKLDIWIPLSQICHSLACLTRLHSIAAERQTIPIVSIENKVEATLFGFYNILKIFHWNWFKKHFTNWCKYLMTNLYLYRSITKALDMFKHHFIFFIWTLWYHKYMYCKCYDSGRLSNEMAIIIWPNH